MSRAATTSRSRQSPSLRRIRHSTVAVADSFESITSSRSLSASSRMSLSLRPSSSAAIRPSTRSVDGVRYCTRPPRRARRSRTCGSDVVRMNPGPCRCTSVASRARPEVRINTSTNRTVLATAIAIAAATSPNVLDEEHRGWHEHGAHDEGQPTVGEAARVGGSDRQGGGIEGCSAAAPQPMLERVTDRCRSGCVRATRLTGSDNRRSRPWRAAARGCRPAARTWADGDRHRPPTGPRWPRAPRRQRDRRSRRGARPQ